VPLTTDRRRLSWRLHASLGPEETRRLERWLAASRVFLAISSIFAMLLEPLPATPRFGMVMALLACYLVLSLVLMFTFRHVQVPPAWLRYFAHGVDTFWPVALAAVSSSRSSALFLFFFFALLAAAYRWRVWETLATAAAMILLPALLALALVLSHSSAVFPPELETSRLFERAISLLVMALLLGYLAGQEKELRAERVAITRLLGKARVEIGLVGTLREMSQEFLRLYGAQRALLVSQEANTLRAFSGEATADGTFRWLEPSPTDRELYLFETPADVWCARNRNGKWSGLALDRSGTPIRRWEHPFLDALAQAQNTHSVAAVSYTLGPDWSGRVFLIKPRLLAPRSEDLRFLQEVVRQVSPAVYNVFLLRRLRQRAGAVERARVARELHDGAVQSLIAVEMQLDVLRRQSEPLAGGLSAELLRVQHLLREEILKLRELMQLMKSLDVDGRKLLPFIADTVERFQRETGIQAQFLSDVEEVKTSAKVCRELAQITQEALVNIRKHSQARHVQVRLAAPDGACSIVIEDDGRGFDFSGHLSLRELDDRRLGPVVIKERVRFIEGELTIESKPGQGSRLEVYVPAKTESSYG
jgi:signal transduction histidine kinase